MGHTVETRAWAKTNSSSAYQSEHLAQDDDAPAIVLIRRMPGEQR